MDIIRDGIGRDMGIGIEGVYSWMTKTNYLSSPFLNFFVLLFFTLLCRLSFYSRSDIEPISKFIFQSLTVLLDFLLFINWILPLPILFSALIWSLGFWILGFDFDFAAITWCFWYYTFARLLVFLFSVCFYFIS